MQEPNKQLLVNCPKCGSGSLTFAREKDPSPSFMRIECLKCGFHKENSWNSHMDAARDWNEG